MDYDYGCVQYEYKMVQMPQTVRVSKEHRKEKAAHYLETLANEQAADGWEFHRIDRVGTVTSPGFLARLMGAQSVRVEYCVVTFRRPVVEAAAEAERTYEEQAPVMTPEEMAAQEAMLEPEETLYGQAMLGPEEAAYEESVMRAEETALAREPAPMPDEVGGMEQEPWMTPEEAAVDPAAPIAPEHPFEATEKAPAQQPPANRPQEEEAA